MALNKGTPNTSHIAGLGSTPIKKKKIYVKPNAPVAPQHHNQPAYEPPDLVWPPAPAITIEETQYSNELVQQAVQNVQRRYGNGFRAFGQDEIEQEVAEELVRLVQHAEQQATQQQYQFTPPQPMMRPPMFQAPQPMAAASAFVAPQQQWQPHPTQQPQQFVAPQQQVQPQQQQPIRPPHFQNQPTPTWSRGNDLQIVPLTPSQPVTSKGNTMSTVVVTTPGFFASLVQKAKSVVNNVINFFRKPVATAVISGDDEIAVRNMSVSRAIATFALSVATVCTASALIFTAVSFAFALLGITGPLLSFLFLTLYAGVILTSMVTKAVTRVFTYITHGIDWIQTKFRREPELMTAAA